VYVQVLSNSVAEALAMEDKPYLKETERFVRKFNKFFDLFNVRSLTEYIKQRKPDLEPYRDVEDKRLKVKIIYDAAILCITMSLVVVEG